MEKKFTRNIGIILLSIDRNYRSPNLLNVVRTSEIGFFELDASTPLKMHNLVISSKLEQFLKLGRNLSDREIATYETHLRAQVSSFSKSSLWTVILEDDAIIDQETIHFFKSLEHFNTQRPMFVNLYPSGGNLRNENLKIKDAFPNIIETKLLHSGAVAYAINNAAHEVISRNLESRVITPADFPPLFNTFEKYLCRASLVMHSDMVKSTIYSLDRTQNNRKLPRIIGFVSLLSFILYRKENVNLKNFLDLELRQRFLLRKLSRPGVSRYDF